MFFKRKTLSETAPKSEKTYEFPFSQSFRGFKRFPIIVYGDKESEENNEKLYKNDFASSIFKFVCSNFETQRKAVLFIDDNKIGTVFDETQVSSIENGLIEKIHVEPKEQEVVDSDGTQIVHRLTVLVKYKDED